MRPCPPDYRAFINTASPAYLPGACSSALAIAPKLRAWRLAVAFPIHPPIIAGYEEVSEYTQQLAFERGGPGPNQPATPHWRPAYHFRPAAHWMNEPNGRFFYQGAYQLFFQCVVHLP